MLPADLPVNEALKSLGVTLPNEKSGKTHSIFTRLAAALNEATASVRPYEAEVIEAKKQLASANKGQLETAQTRLRVAQSWQDAATKCLSDYAAGKLDVSAAQRAVESARARVGGLEARLASGAEDPKLINGLLEGARTELQYAEMQAEATRNPDQWKQGVPAQFRDLADVLAKMTLVVSDRNAWILRVYKSRPEELPKVQATALAPAGQIGPRMQLFLEMLVDGAITESDAKINGVQQDIKNYFGENGTLITTINNGLALLSKSTEDPEAKDLRDDLTRLLKAVQNPEGGAQQLLRIAQADPKQVMRLGKQLWKPAD